MQTLVNQLLKKSSVIFWDFDGVIKDSLEVKASAFENLFSEYDQTILNQIKKHHFEFGGLSRFEKIPIYLDFAGIPRSQINIEKYTKKFSTLVKQSVIDSPWVPGAIEYIKSHYMKKQFFIVTATPKFEIDEILVRLGISNFFIEAYGSPTPKTKALALAIEKFQCDSKKTIMIGDSMSDYKSALQNNITFVLRQTEFNITLQNDLNCLMLKDFANE
jgi:HAD superfamily hydrolase (TIGR01549 family)